MVVFVQMLMLVRRITTSVGVIMPMPVPTGIAVLVCVFVVHTF